MVRNSLNYVGWNKRDVVAADLKRIYTAATEAEAAQYLTEFETISYTSLRSTKKALNPVRCIVFHDAELEREFVFTTNRFDWSASLVAQIYKQRWQVELFFKWIKQNLKLKCFVGLSDNANYGGDVCLSTIGIFEV
jgi:hypothetical protein